MCFNPSLREINLQLGGKIEETRTMLHAAIPALRRASSKLESLSRCLPTPLVRKIFFAPNAIPPACPASALSLPPHTLPPPHPHQERTALPPQPRTPDRAPPTLHHPALTPAA